MPKTAAGVGQVQVAKAAASGAFTTTVPAGGTWICFIIGSNYSQGLTNPVVEVLAGGASLPNNYGHSQAFMFMIA